MERNFNLGDVHIMLCTGDVLLSYTLETCVVLQTNVTRINSINKKAYAESAI